MLTGQADDGIILMSTIVDNFSLKEPRHLAGCGPQLARECSNEGSPGALDARGEKRCRSFFTSDPGDVDLPHTIPLPDSATNARTPMPKNIADRDGRSLRAINHKFDRVKKHGIMTGTEEMRSEKNQSQDILKASSPLLLERDRCDNGPNGYVKEIMKSQNLIPNRR